MCNVVLYVCVTAVHMWVICLVRLNGFHRDITHILQYVKDLSFGYKFQQRFHTYHLQEMQYQRLKYCKDQRVDINNYKECLTLDLKDSD